MRQSGAIPPVGAPCVGPSGRAPEWPRCRPHDAQLAVDAFVERLRDEVDLDTLRTHLLATVDATLEPTVSGLRLRK
jgi:hypothetical protein